MVSYSTIISFLNFSDSGLCYFFHNILFYHLILYVEIFPSISALRPRYTTIFISLDLLFRGFFFLICFLSLNGIKPNTFYNSHYKFCITIEWVFLYLHIRAVSYVEVCKQVIIASLDPEFQGFPSCCYHKVFKNLWFLSVTIYLIFSEICLFQCPFSHISPSFLFTTKFLP